LDVAGLALARESREAAVPVAGVVRAWAGPPRAHLIGLAGAYPAATAALVTGTLAHALDFDDTHLPSILHPSAVLVPAGLAVAEACERGGRDLVVALAAGYEILVRLGMTAYDGDLRNSVFFEKGLHATSICGTVAAAVVAARLMDGDSQAIEAAIGIASSFGAGLLEANRTGGTVKRIHCGWAAHSGIAAAEFAAAGITGPPTVLEGRFGFFHGLCDGDFDAAILTDGLGDRWEVPGIVFKPYPANHFTHAGIDAAIALRAAGVEPDDIVRVDVGAPEPTLRTIAEPVEVKRRPPNGYAARFSGPFTFAAALLGGGGLGVYLDDFSDARADDPAVLALADRVHHHADEECLAAYPGSLPGIVTVRLRSGEVIEHRVFHNRGGLERPLTRQELLLKFELNARRGQAGTDESIAAVAEAIWHLERMGSVAELGRLLSGQTDPDK
ncbi:MAG: MmgE/PrpD family protein, partial [Actinobacteria bacterium]|nr:MmgE/PrpD family protein [Actinomycetota bacterium]